MTAPEDFMAPSGEDNEGFLMDQSPSSEESPPDWFDEAPPLEAYEGVPAEADLSGGYRSGFDSGEITFAVVERFLLPSIEDEKRIVQGLNPEQSVAVTLAANAGPVLVLAGAGTGKTSVLTRRIAYIHKCGADPRQILAVTFTNKAAREMKERLQKLGVHPLPVVGTFHGIGNLILRQCPDAAGVRKNFTIMDDSDMKTLWKRLFVAPKGTAPDTARVQLAHGDLRTQDMERAMFALKERGMRYYDAKQWEHVKLDYDGCLRGLSAAQDPISWVGKMLNLYEEERKRLNLVDFTDLVSASLVAMRDSEPGKRWAARFSHVLVDEFQDTSEIQFRWATTILSGRPGGEKAQNIFAVGDDSQSIYAFRGAKIGNMESYVQRFGAIEIMLEQNYRCGSDILKAANLLIAHNPGGDRKKLWTNGAAGQVECRFFGRDSDEAEWLAKHAQDARANRETAILVRTRASMIPIMTAVRRYGLQYRVVGAQDFFDRREIRDAMALLRFAANQDDLLSFARAALLFDGVGKGTIDKLVSACRSANQSILKLCANHKSVKIQAIASAFHEIDGHSKAEEAMARLAKDSGLAEACLADEDLMRMQNLKEFIEMAGQFGIISDFLEEMTLFAEKKDADEGLTVSTIHAAKGLEWDRVYLPALSQGHLPSERADMTNEEIVANLEEERRLMYVAITRAKHGLFVSSADSRMLHGSIIRCKPSQFLYESELVRQIVKEPAQRVA